MAAESRQCQSCHNFDSLELIATPENDHLWVEREGQTFAVQQFRCVACGLVDLVARDFWASQEGIKPAPGQATAGDGRKFAVRPIPNPQLNRGVTRGF